MINGEQNTIIIETKRLYLREIRDSDLEGLRDILGDKDVMEFSIHGAEDTQGIKRFIKGTKERYRIHCMAQWAVILKEAGQFIGECGISVQHIDNVEEFEIGYRFAKKYWGEGYATEAAIACQKYGTEQFSVKRYISIIEKENIRSIRVAEKGGMTLEKESVFHGIPVLIYSLEV